MSMLEPLIKKNDRKARTSIILVSVIVFAAIVILGRVKLDIETGFDVHIFAKANAVINSIVACLLVIGLIAVKGKNYKLHRNIMITAIMLSVLFLISYIGHHLLAGETRFGDTNHDGVVTELEKSVTGNSRIMYYILLGTHIPLAGIILPFILFTAYRGLTGEYTRHRKLARITWPVWFYVAVSGVLVYWMISPFY